MKINFFRALFGTCAGIAIFEKLQFQSFARAILHLLLMSIVSAAIIACGVYPELKTFWHNTLTVIADNCGTIICSNERIAPALEPEKMRMFTVGGSLAITYLPAGAVELPENFQQGCANGLIWQENGKFLLWNAAESNKYYVVQITNPVMSMNKSEVFGREALFAELQKTQQLNIGFKKGETEELTAAKLGALGELAVIVGLSGMLFQKTLLEVILYIGMFACVSLLMNIGRPRRMPFKVMIVLAIYAGLPPMLIGSVAEALQLPFLNFNIIYVLGMTFYLIVVMNRLERLRQEREWQQQGQ